MQPGCYAASGHVVLVSDWNRYQSYGKVAYQTPSRDVAVACTYLRQPSALPDQRLQ